jgi:hypothetical protein
MTTRSDAQTNAVQIRDEVGAGANTATRVGTAMKQVADNAAFTGDAPTVHATSHKSGGGDAIRLDELAVPTAAVALNGQQITGLAAATVDTGAANLGQVGIISARVCTTASLPAYTYANGASGVGATIILNANAAIPPIDGVTMAVGDLVLLQHGTSFADNWIYAITALGDGSTTPGVLTRSTLGDTPAKILGSVVKIREGNSRRGAVYEYCGRSSITIGTTALAGLRIDGNRGPNEYWRGVEDFDQENTVVANGAVMKGPLSLIVNVSAASLIAAAVSTETHRGVVTLSTGVSPTGNSSLTGVLTTIAPIKLDVSQFVELEIYAAGPSALSDGTNTFRVQFGLATAAGLATTSGILVDYTQTEDTHWQFKCIAASTPTAVAGATVAATTYGRFVLRKYAGESTFDVLQDGVLMGNIATNVPMNTILTPHMTIVKSLGATPRSYTVDYWSLIVAHPQGRGV